MCILVVSTAAQLRKTLTDVPGLVDSFIQSNPDGLGVMFPSDDGMPVMHKTLPESAQDALRWILATVPGDERQVALHARFGTHGSRSMDNIHPYELDGGLLMHNGVLSCDTHTAKERSDTWHYCRQYLDGNAQSLFASEQGRAILGDHIGYNNRFAYLGADAHVHIVNKETGVEYAGCWFSNTYAWDVGLLDPTWARRYIGGAGDPRKQNKAKWWYERESESASITVGGKPMADYYRELEREQLMLDGDDLGVDPCLDWRDGDGSLAWLAYSHEDNLAEALDDCGGDLIEQLVQELGKPTIDGRVSPRLSRAGHETIFDKTLEYIADGDYYRVEHFIDEGHAGQVADAIIYGLIWPTGTTHSDEGADAVGVEALPDVA